jgi:hypothetical protein
MRDPCQCRHRLALRTWWSVKRDHDAVPYIRREHKALSLQMPFQAVMANSFHPRAPTYCSIKTTLSKKMIPARTLLCSFHELRGEKRRRNSEHDIGTRGFVAWTLVPADLKLLIIGRGSQWSCGLSPALQTSDIFYREDVLQTARQLQGTVAYKRQ